MNPPEIRELVAGDYPEAVRLLAVLNPSVPVEVLEQRFMTILAEHPHYHAYGAFLDGKLAGLASAWIATKVWCGRYLEVDNIVVDPEIRSAGVGTLLVQHLEALAREKDCNLAVLDSYTSNHASHRLYHRLGFEIWGFHFVKPLGPLDR
ncbi:GNAT family N-acetyltransferase [Luteolibacter flavescens]|uniref:GNAT family N-acetyltransferase n=1 Tax=Luteolibacter flavescens TaxID=1859460 RepID=A0ABT3FS81_9BACT|nr:GNAT family N-acetyltransferase [Luteolibacter flavescens]MCW1886428.1 GNAT family N-acetyltransferase [Luteolibacter flavescens]